MARLCDATHCSAVDAEISDVCKIENWQINRAVPTRDGRGKCYCACSGLALNTPIAVGQDRYQAVQELRVGDTVLAAGPSLRWESKEVLFSEGTTGNPRQPFSVFLAYGERSLIVTADHLFLLADGRLRRADRLSTDDCLVSPDGAPVAITSVHIGDFYGGFHHIATSKTPPGPSLDGHLLDTNGVVSADYAVQLFHQAGSLDPRLASAADLALPIIGSDEYVAQHGPPPALVPAQQIGEIGFVSPSVANPAPGAFVPAGEATTRIPKDACQFISDEDAEILRKTAPKRLMTDFVSQVQAEALAEFYRRSYGDVTYHIDWYDETVNAFAWVDRGVRHVALKGGMLRVEYLEEEGIALVLAHELAHHYGGQPTYSNGLSCEGQADFFGARNIMRKIWVGESYLSTMEKAIKQLKRFLRVLPSFRAAALAGGCTHPPGACRIETYNAAVELRPKPACA